MITAFAVLFYGLLASLLTLVTLVVFDYEPDFDDIRWYDRILLTIVSPMCFILSAFEGWTALRDEVALFYEMVILGSVSYDD